MKRKQYADLLSWKDRSNRKPLVIRGARQVGKTYLVREFAQTEFENYIEINFDETPDKKDLFIDDDIDLILKYIYLDAGKEIVSGKTLIFLDEIQRAPEIFAKLRYFYEKRNDIHLIAAGSLLDFTLADFKFSMPVGRIEYLFMGPLDFLEFLNASGEYVLHTFISQYNISELIPDTIHKKLQDLLRVYMTVGGMPSALREYIESGSISQCEMELSSILNTYRDDFSKYGNKVNSIRLRMVLDRVPGIIGKKVKYTEISRDDKSVDLKAALQLLEFARVIYKIHHSSANGIPLRSEKKEQDFKLLFLDMGLMMRSLGLSLLDLRDDGILLANKGALAEQFIGQQLLYQKESYSEPELFYWNREKEGTSSEIDYLFQIDGRIIPVEVKSGTTGSLKSLHVFATDKKSTIAVRFNQDKPSLADITSKIPTRSEHTFKLLSLPLYMVSEMQRLVQSV
ncbi:MAG: ATP-binding protein [Spirochaetaceae bacterium]|jgi:predicted AAA+ superfamily ATPase|nr:ATP-binding protein [Spirochaetaceae bacterium]